MDSVELRSQESGIDVVLDENQAQRHGNGYGIKKRSFTLDTKTTVLEELDAARLVQPKVRELVIALILILKGALSRIAKKHNISRQTLYITVFAKKYTPLNLYNFPFGLDYCLQTRSKTIN